MNEWTLYFLFKNKKHKKFKNPKLINKKTKTCENRNKCTSITNKREKRKEKVRLEVSNSVEKDQKKGGKEEEEKLLRHQCKRPKMKEKIKP